MNANEHRQNACIEARRKSLPKDLHDYVRNRRPKLSVTRVKAAVAADSAIVTQTITKVLRTKGNVIDTAIAGALPQLRQGAQATRRKTRAHRNQS